MGVWLLNREVMHTKPKKKEKKFRPKSTQKMAYIPF